MSRIYTVEFEAQAITAANGDYDLFELLPADDKPIEVIDAEIIVTSELQEAEEEWLRLKWIRGHTTSGSGGGISTPAPVDPADAAAGFTCEVHNPTIATLGTTVDLRSTGFNVRQGYYWTPIPEARLKCSQAQTSLILRMMAAVADDVTMSGTLTILEH